MIEVIRSVWAITIASGIARIEPVRLELLEHLGGARGVQRRPELVQRPAASR